MFEKPFKCHIKKIEIVHTSIIPVIQKLFESALLLLYLEQQNVELIYIDEFSEIPDIRRLKGGQQKDQKVTSELTTIPLQ